jgi:hypothetical protein
MLQLLVAMFGLNEAEVRVTNPLLLDLADTVVDCTTPPIVHCPTTFTLARSDWVLASTTLKV